MPRVNLLPWREADRKRRRQEFMFSIVAAIGSAALVTLAGRGLMAGAISHQETRNRALETQIVALEKHGSLRCVRGAALRNHRARG